MKKNKWLWIVSILFLLFIGIIMSVSLFSKLAIETVLRRAGFAGATVESASVSLSGTNLKNIALGDSRIGNIDAYATLPDLLARRLGKVVVADAELRWPVLPASEETDTSAGPLNIYSRDIAFTNARLILPLAEGEMAVTLNGSVTDRGPDYQLQADYQAEGAGVTAAGTVTATINKQTRKTEAHIEINEAAVSIDPAIDMKRLAGWIEATVTPGEDFPAINAQLSAGGTRLYGVPFQGLTLTATPDNIVLNGNVPNDGGDISAEIKIDRADAALDRLAVNLGARLKNLEALGLEKLKGRGSLSLDLRAEKDKAAAWQDMAQWKNFAGSGDLSAKGLTLPGLIDKAEAASKVTLALDPAARTLSLQSRDASYSDARVALKGGTADLTLHLAAAPVVEGKLSIAELTQKSSPAYIVPVKLALSFQPLSSSAAATGFSGEITEKNGLLYAKLDGRVDIAAKSGTLRVNMPPVNLIKGVQSLKDIFPASQEYVEEGNGTIGFSAEAAFTQKQGKTVTTTKGELFLKNFTGIVKENEITNVNTVLTLESLMPLAFSNQKISVGSVNVGLPLTNGELEASLSADRVFTAHRAEWELAKGRISSSPFSLPLDDMTTDVTLTATRLDLPELFKIAPMEGLDATGTVNGILPLHIRKGSAAIENGVLETEGSGYLRYNPAEPPAFLKNPSNQQIADLGIALKAFEYETLKITLNGEVGTDQKIALQIKGKNPEFYDGRAVSLNLNVEGPLQNVLKYKPGGSQIPDTIKKQLEQYEKTHAKQ